MGFQFLPPRNGGETSTGLPLVSPGSGLAGRWPGFSTGRPVLRSMWLAQVMLSTKGKAFCSLPLLRSTT
ncbi:hypothetical protein D3C72_1591700 [compost metagenome]